MIRLLALAPFFCECKSLTFFFFFCPFFFLFQLDALVSFFVPDSTLPCRGFSWGSPRTWPTVTPQPAVRWRTVILVMTMLGMTTRHGLCSRQVRLIRQAGEPEHLLRDSIREFGLDLAVIFWRTLLLSPGSVAPFLLSSAQRNFGTLLRANTVLCFLVSQSL